MRSYYARVEHKVVVGIDIVNLLAEIDAHNYFVFYSCIENYA